MRIKPFMNAKSISVWVQKLLALAAFAMIAAISMAASQSQQDYESEELNPQGYIDKVSLWPNPFIIDVCWNPNTDQWVRERSMVENTVRTTIQGTTDDHVSDIHFTKGWKDCQPGVTGIQVSVADIRPNSDIGRQGGALKTPDGSVPTKVTLNFSFQDAFQDCADHRDVCIRSIAVHEFLHAVGFLHENRRDDTPRACYAKFAHEPDVAARHPLKFGNYDKDSIMNYCSNIFRDPVKLSRGDRNVLANFYTLQ